MHYVLFVTDVVWPYGELPLPTTSKHEFDSQVFLIEQIQSLPGILFGFAAYIRTAGVVYIQVWRPTGLASSYYILISERRYEHAHDKPVSDKYVQEVC